MERANPEQLRAIRFGPGRMMVLAGPGAGKTFVITHRILYLIRSLGVSPDKILVITFTKAAAASMRERFLNLSGPEGRSVCFGTFHAIFYHLIKEKYAVFRPEVLTEPEKRRLIHEITERFYPEFMKAGIMLPLSRESMDLLQKELTDDTADLSKETYKFPDKLIRDMKVSYREIKRELRKIDFHDMETEANRILNENPEMRDRWQKRFQYILIDEFQDISKTQYEIIKILALPENNIFIVGDDDQSIYGFRGASPAIMKQFEEDGGSSTVTVRLQINYRSSETVVASALQLIRHNTLRYPKDLAAFSEGGKEVSFRSFSSKEEEISCIAEEIGASVRSQSLAPCDIAILCRTTSEFGFLGQVLSSKGISFYAKEKLICMYEHEHVEDLLSYLRLSTGKYRRTDLLRVMNRPARFLSRSFLDRTEYTKQELQHAYSEASAQQRRALLDLLRDLDRISGLKPYGALNLIRKGIGYDRYLKDTIREEEEKKKVFAELDDVVRASKEYKSFHEFEDKVKTMIREFHDHRMEETQGTLPKEAVTLSTMHGSKGLEYKRVYIPFCIEGVTPHKKATEKPEMEEERRLFYVAMTRAKEELFLSAHKIEGKNECELSRFVQEAGLIRCETRKDVL